MPFRETTATVKVKQMRKRIRLLAGGTSASKTISVLLYLIAKCQYDKTPTLTSVVSESFPHLRRGAMRDFLNIMQQHSYFKDELWSKTDFTYTFETGSKLEFFSADQPSKVRGPRRDRLFINEANNVPKEAWEQLLLRTKEFAIADWNPVADFYMYEDYGLVDEPEEGVAPHAADPDTDFIILTYKDNEALDAAIVGEIEKRRINKQWFKVYGEGKRGEVEGKIFTGWKVIDEVPHEARLERRGLDFGYSNDPTALVDIYYYNGGYIVDEQLYRKGMHNKDIADKINSLPEPQTLVIADSAEPKSIDEIANYGCNITGVEKKGYGGKTFTNAIIDYVQSQKMSITSRSSNVRKSYDNFMWKTDKEGHILNEYDHYWSDGMMAVAYAMDSLRPNEAVANAAYFPDDMLQRQMMNGLV
jgi:phage terminase large subunit